MKNKKQSTEGNGKIVHGSTPEERFIERHGMNYNEWEAKQEEKFIAETGMTYHQWVINRYKSLTPIDLLREQYGAVSEADIKLVKDLRELGINDGVINVLLEYILTCNGIGLVHTLVIEMGANWFKEKIFSVEDAIFYIREKQNKYKESSKK